MKKRTWISVVVVVLSLSALLPEASFGRHSHFRRFFRWWTQPPAEAVADVTFDTVNATNA
jgi:hypothetical protein